VTQLLASITSIAELIRAVDPRIHYAPFCFHNSGIVSVAFAVESDEALKEIAARFDLPVRVANNSASMWLRAGDDVGISFYGPHHDMPRTDTEDDWRPAQIGVVS